MQIGLSSMDKLESIRDRLTEQLKIEFIELLEDEFAFSIARLNEGDVAWTGYRQDVPIYPASVVKLFYAIAAYRWLELARIQQTTELDRAIKDMIVDSSNDATSYIVDLLTGTTSGPELSEKEMVAWIAKRNAMNKFFAAQGYTRVNVNQKPWSDGPYGREKRFVESQAGGRNMLTTAETARLLVEVIRRKAASERHCDELLAHMVRDKSISSNDPDNQTHGFLAAKLPVNLRVWSKAGWTSKVRHDAACIDLGKSTVVCVLFTENHSDRPAIIHRFGELLVSKMQSVG